MAALTTRGTEEKIGNGKAVFFEDGTEEEEAQFIKDSKHGWGKFNSKVRELFN